MPIRKLNPYLTFNGDAADAIALYERVLDAKVEMLQRFGEVPGSDPASPHQDRVIHARLRIGDDTVMISDSMPDQPVTLGGNVHMTLDFDDIDEMNRRFDALSEGGRVGMPLQDTFWGARFGMLTDAHGVNWMFNCQLATP